MKNNKYTRTIESLKNDMEDGLLFCDIWSKETGLSLEGYNPNAKYSALFGKITQSMEKALNDLGLPLFGKYQIIDLEADAILFIINLDEKHLLGGLADKNLVNMGILLNFAIPNAIETFKS